MSKLNAKPFTFQNEFTPDGEFLSGNSPSYRRVEEVEDAIAAIRKQTQDDAMASIEARIAASLEAILAQLSPTPEKISEIAKGLRNEAIDLAMTATKVVAGRALDEFGEDTASEAVAQAAKQLRQATRITVLVTPEAEAAIALRVQNMPGVNSNVSFIADPAARPGDWRIEFDDGAVGFDRDRTISVIEACLDQRKDDPVEDQLDLFGAA